MQRLESRQIVSIERAKRGRRVLVLDDGAEVELSSARIRDAGLAAGDAVDAGRLADLSRDDARELAHDTALRLLAYRPRTEQEVRLKLRQRGIDGETIDREVRRLRMAGLLDDERFAESWVEGRQRNSARSARALAGELRAKGIDRETAEAATDDVDDEAAALELARSRAGRMTGVDQETRERRLAGLLQRRGFSFRVIERVLRQLEAELDTAPAESTIAQDGELRGSLDGGRGQTPTGKVVDFGDFQRSTRD